jgi:hypothetical protein
METLPDELKLHIARYLDYPDLTTISQMNESFRQVCEEESLWKRLFQRDFPNDVKWPNVTWRQSYVELWTWRQSIKIFARQFTEEHSLIKSKYIRLDEVVNDLVDLLETFMNNHNLVVNGVSYRVDDLDDLTEHMLEIISGLRSDYIGDGSGQLNVYHLNTDYRGRIYRFLKGLGYRVSAEEAYEYLNDEDEAPTSEKAPEEEEAPEEDNENTEEIEQN